MCEDVVNLGGNQGFLRQSVLEEIRVFHGEGHRRVLRGLDHPIAHGYFADGDGQPLRPHRDLDMQFRLLLPQVTCFKDAHLVRDQVCKDLVGLKGIVDVNGFPVYLARKGKLHPFFGGRVMEGIQYKLCHLIWAADLEVVVLLDAVRQDVIQERTDIRATGIEKDCLQYGCLADVIDAKEQIQL